MSNFQTEKERVDAIAETAQEQYEKSLPTFQQFNPDIRAQKIDELRQRVTQPLVKMANEYGRKVERLAGEIDQLKAYEPFDNLSADEYQKLGAMPAIKTELSKLNDREKRERWQAVQANGSETLKLMYSTALGVEYNPKAADIEALTERKREATHAHTYTQMRIKDLDPKPIAFKF